MRLITLAIVLSGCGSAELRDHVTSAPKPFKHSIEAELEPYWERFSELTNARSKHVAGFFKTLESPTVGLCTSYTDGSRKIEIDPQFWQDSTPLGKEELVFHELGHCALNLGHNDELIDLKDYGTIPASIMYPYVFGEASYYEQFRDYYVRELNP